jgi:hypothetical protein
VVEDEGCTSAPGEVHLGKGAGAVSAVDADSWGSEASPVGRIEIELIVKCVPMLSLERQ